MSKRSIGRKGAAALAGAIGLVLAGQASAQTADNWVGTTGNWVDGTNWDLGHAPTIAANELAQINNAGTAQIAGVDAAEADIVYLGQQSGQSGTLQISGGTLNTAQMRVGGVDTRTANSNLGRTGP